LISHACFLRVPIGEQHGTCYHDFLSRPRRSGSSIASTVFLVSEIDPNNSGVL
jgi:hypothetical protein